MEIINKKILGSFLIVILFLVVILLIPKKHTVAEIKGINIGGQNIAVDLALTPAAQEQGLSGRPSLAGNTGMLFVFSTPGQYAFWMKDMNFPIDMIWLDQNLRVIYIKKDARPELYPETYGPTIADGSATYVLEVSDGFSDKNNLQVGDSVRFTY